MELLNFLAVLGHASLILPIASAAQQPLLSENPHEVQTRRWNFNYSSEAPHYFASAYGLLQQWSNTFFPNGHSIVPCEIPPFTKLYHGRMDGNVPPSPEWVAFDIGMAYGIMGGSRNSHMLTYQTTRRVKCLYFDGESATLFGSGQLDTQNLHIWGNVSGPTKRGDGFRGLWEEYARATGLCDWIHEKELGGPGWGYEGIVRMNAGFEMIWCNFSSPSARLISHLNITAPLLPELDDDEASMQNDVSATSYYPLPPSPTRSDRATDPADPPRPPVGGGSQWLREPFFRSQAWSWYTSATTHYGSNGDGPGLGEAHVKPITCGFLSYYSPEFLSQAIPRAEKEKEFLNLTMSGLWKGVEKSVSRAKALQALTRRRRYHDLEKITPTDASIMKLKSERVLHDLASDSPANCSGLDWSIVTNDIVQTYGSSLINFVNTLNGFQNTTANNATALKNWMTKVRDESHAFLLPFLEYPDGVAADNLWSRDSTLFQVTYSRCRFQFTRLLDPEEGIYLGPEETLLQWSVEETTGGICSTLVDVGLSVEGLWQAKFDFSLIAKSASIDPEAMKSEVSRWTEGVEELMAWLGWAGEWARCEKKCAWDESCYIPMWPMIPFGRGRRGRGPPRYRPGYRGPPYGRPGYGWRYHDFPPNGTIDAPGRGFNPWQPDEDNLWDPQCVKSDYLVNA